MIIYFISSIIFFIVSFIFSILTTSFITLNQYNVLSIDSKNEKKYNLVKNLVSKKQKVITVLQLSRQISFVLSIILFSNWIDNIFDKYLISDHINVIITSFLFIFLIILFEQGLPQTIGNTHYKKVVLYSAFFVSIYTKIINPFLFFHEFLNKLLNKISKSKDYHSIEEIRLIAEEAKNSGLIEDFGFKMISKATIFKNISASDIMIPVRNTITVNLNDTYEECLKVYQMYSYSKLPVLDENNEVVGIFNCKNFLKLNNNQLNDLKISNYLSKAAFLPETVNLSKVLEKIREEKFEIILLADEYGSFSGLITMKDIIERVFGKIEDLNNSNQKRQIYKIKSKSEAIVEGSASIKDLVNIVKIPIPTDILLKHKTINALLVELKGSFLKKEDKINYLDYEFYIEETDKYLATKIHVKKLEKE